MTLTPEQLAVEKKKADLMLKSIELEDAGKKEEARALMKQIPLPPWLAEVTKKMWGADFLIQGGYNLSDAEAKFGQGWLNR